MLNFIQNYYLWIKAVHVISVICWMAGMLYMPRLFVYHCRVPAGSEQSKLFSMMEMRLGRMIMAPAIVIAFITGLMLAWGIYDFHGGWLHLKLAAAIILSAYHGFLVTSAKRFARGANPYSEKAWRILNEVPTVLMIIAVIAVIVKPDLPM